MIELKHFIDRGVDWIHLLLLFRANSGLLKEFEIICEGSWTGWSNKALHQMLHLMLPREGSPLSKKRIIKY